MITSAESKGPLVPHVPLELLEGSPPLLDRHLKQVLMRTFGVFKGLLHPYDVGFKELNALGVRCSGQEQFPSYCKPSCLLEIEGRLGSLGDSRKSPDFESSELALCAVIKQWRKFFQCKLHIRNGPFVA